MVSFATFSMASAGGIGGILDFPAVGTVFGWFLLAASATAMSVERGARGMG